MDCHDGDYEPEVYHKKTLTSKVPVRDICQAINKYAFVSSPWPVIISTEVHCSLEQQERLGVIMREVFGDRLVTAPVEEVSGMASPEQLKGRILFKVGHHLATLTIGQTASREKASNPRTPPIGFYLVDRYRLWVYPTCSTVEHRQ